MKMTELQPLQPQQAYTPLREGNILRSGDEVSLENYHARQGEIAPPTQEWIREFKLAQAAAQPSAEAKLRQPTPQEAASQEIMGYGRLVQWRYEAVEKPAA
jgi:hypothetical protein